MTSLSYLVCSYASLALQVALPGSTTDLFQDWSVPWNPCTQTPPTSVCVCTCRMVPCQTDVVWKGVISA